MISGWLCGDSVSPEFPGPQKGGGGGEEGGLLPPFALLSSKKANSNRISAECL